MAKKLLMMFMVVMGLTGCSTQSPEVYVISADGFDKSLSSKYPITITIEEVSENIEIDEFIPAAILEEPILLAETSRYDDEQEPVSPDEDELNLDVALKLQELFMATDEYQWIIVEGILNGIYEYFDY